jgi:hypothetical protein
LAGIGTYLLSLLTEGVVIGMLFWAITYLTLESTSLSGALRAAFIAEAVGNLPYLFGTPGLSPPGIAMTMIAALIFWRLIIRIGELTPFKAAYGVSMTYFVLVALVACNA